MTCHHPHPPMTPTAVSHCLQDGFSSVLPRAGGNCHSLAHLACYEPTVPPHMPCHLAWGHDAAPMMVTVTWCCHCYQLLYSKTPAIAGLLRSRSSKQHSGRQQVYPYLSGPWLVTCGLQVRVTLLPSLSWPLQPLCCLFEIPCS